MINSVGQYSISSWRVNHSISARKELDWVSYNESSTADVPLPKSYLAPKIFSPYSYSSDTSSWRPLKSVSGQGSLDQGNLLRVVSWNIDFRSPGLANHASSAMDHLKESFRGSATSLSYYAPRGAPPVTGCNPGTSVDKKNHGIIGC